MDRRSRRRGLLLWLLAVFVSNNLCVMMVLMSRGVSSLSIPIANVRRRQCCSSSAMVLRSMEASSAYSSYRFLDAGDQMRLEQFGEKIVARSCVSAFQPKMLPDAEWQKAHLRYVGTTGKLGKWNGDVDNVGDWKVQFDHITLSLSPSDMGQVGVFPEQEENWKWLGQTIKKYNARQKEIPRPLNILNGFAYTGAASIACCVAPNVKVSLSSASFLW